MTDFGTWVFGLVALFLPGFGDPPPRVYNGYVEADYVYAAPANAGRIDTMAVKQGDLVLKGQLLFELQSDQQTATLRAAQAQKAVAEATWHNLETGSRVEEVAVINASLSQAEADGSLAALTFERSVKLQEQGLTPDAKVDADRAALISANARIEQLRAQLNVAELPARDAQLVAAEASLDAAIAEADRALFNLEDRAVTAPIDALVERVFFRSGEVAGAGTPVIVLLPPDALKARFFIPEADRALFQAGIILNVECESCPGDLTATVSYLASEPQHTPPIIYSREERARLVFMAEARLEPGTQLLPGQPLTLVHQ